MARGDAVPGKPFAHRGDLDVQLAVGRLQEAELLQLARPRGIDARTVAELVDAEVVCLDLPERRRGALSPRLRNAGRELFADHAERQELVSLHAQDRLEPLEVLLGEEPVPALCPPRRHEAFALEVADLRDRDVRELRLQPAADGSDGEQAGPGAGFGGRHQRARNVSRYLPIWISSPSLSSDDSTRRRLTNVPFRLPWSSTNQRASRSTSTACRRETVTSAR